MNALLQPNRSTLNGQVFAIALSFLLAACAASDSETLMRARNVEVSLMRNLPSGAMNWIHQQADNLADGRTDEDGVRQASTERIRGEDPNGRLTDVLTFFVTMEAVRKLDTKAVQRDGEQKAIDAVKLKLDALSGKLDEDIRANSGKDDSDPCACAPYEPALTDLQGALEKSPSWITVSAREPLDVGDLKAMKQHFQNLYETLGELSEMTAHRIQKSQDRQTKLMSTISYLLKKVSDTQSGIIQNMK